jgi:hypothetical protein
VVSLSAKYGHSGGGNARVIKVQKAVLSPPHKKLLRIIVLSIVSRLQCPLFKPWRNYKIHKPFHLQQEHYQPPIVLENVYNYNEI